MFYRAEDGHPLPHNPFKAIISPRPIAWISTIDTRGNANLAPYSFFNGIADAPMQVMFASTASKPDQGDTVVNDAHARASLKRRTEATTRLQSASRPTVMRRQFGKP